MFGFPQRSKRRFGAALFAPGSKRQRVAAGPSSMGMRLAMQRRNMRFRRVLGSQRRRHGEEVKAIDTIVGSAAGKTFPINNTCVVQPMNLVQIGSTFCQRIGRRISMQSVHLHGSIDGGVNQNFFNDYCRMLIVYDRQTNGTLPSIVSILQNTDTNAVNVAPGAANTQSAYIDLNLNNRERYLVLMDERIWLPPCNSAGAGNTLLATEGSQKTQFNINRFVKLKGLETHFQADTINPPVIGDVATGGLYLVIVGSATAGTEGYNADLSWRLRYTDA